MISEKKVQLQIGNTTITPLGKKDQLLESINLNDDEASERDEAEGDEDDDLGAESEESEEDMATDRGQAVKL